jgi:hypothetical protein
MKTRMKLMCLVLVCGLGAVASAEIMGHWKLDEGSGDTVADISGNDNHGTIENAVWGKGKSGAALEFNGTDARVLVPDSPSLHPATGEITIGAWVKVAADTSGWSAAASIVHKNGGYQWAVEPAGSLWFGVWGGALRSTGNYDFNAHIEEWHHVAVTFVDASNATVIYVDGEVNSQGSVTAAIDVTTNPVYLGWKQDGNGYFHGTIDEVVVDDSAYTQAQVLEIMKTTSTLSGNPSPETDSTDVLRDAVLEWTAGEFAVTHDLYLGTTFADVNDATQDNPLGVLVDPDLDVTTYDPEGLLAFGQTYYWRVDEVNGAPDFTAFKGEVWTFTAEPFAYPIENVTATASSAHDGDMIPEKTIDGSGMDALNLHSSEPKHMWLSGMGDPEPSIQYEFDRAYKLHEMWVWNSNQLIEGFVGLGAKDVSIEISSNGADWTLLEGTPPFAQAPGKAGYAHNTTIDFGGAMAQYVKLTVNAGYGMLPQSGLSEVRFLYVPTFAREPQPADAEVTDGVDVVLGWRAGREAASHEVYLGTDSMDLALVQTVHENSAAIGPLDYATTYYWQIVEVNDAETPASNAGDVWSFSTPAYGTVDDFDQYDNDCQRIFFAWEDGLGHNGGEDVDDCDMAPSNGNGGGSIVGNASAPFAERTIVRSGQSMPLEYDNAFGPSEATLSLDSQDWSAHGIKSLSLYFRGDPGNTGQLYVKINNTKVAYDGLPGALQRPQWLPWNIDLSTVAGNLQSVTSLAIGIEGATASGMLYVDNIRVYPLTPESIAPIDPDPANLVAHYAFEGNANDSVGGLNGSLVGNAAFESGQQGQALSLNTLTVTDYVEITGYQGILGADAITVAAWVNTDSDATAAIIGWGPNVGSQRFGFRIDGGRLRNEHGNGNIQGDTVINDGNWHHVAVTVQPNATVSHPEVQLWLDGQDDTRPTTDPDAFDLTADPDVSIGRRPANDDRYYIGLIDELYIYNRALSQAEIAALAGLSQPFDKPFSD